MVLWFASLEKEYGHKLLLILFATQHLLKGVTQQFQSSSIMWLFREYGVSGPQMQIYASVSNSAWALKPIIGLVSDLVPISGLRKAPYIVISSCVGVVCAATIGLSTKGTTSVLTIVLCLFGMSLQASTCDLLTEAKYSENLLEKPALGPDLISYVWGGITTGNLIATAMVGLLISNFGPRAVFLVCVFPCATVLYPTFKNYFEEERVTPTMIARLRRSFAQQGEVLGLCGLMTILTGCLTFSGAAFTSHTVHFVVALLVLLILLPSFHVVLRPEISRVNTFFLLQAVLTVNINGATFYFYTDNEIQYPEGPHFSAFFATTGVGFVSSITSLVGLYVYTKYMKHLTYRTLLMYTNIFATILSMLDSIIFMRLNVRYGIPDTAFVLGSSVSNMVVKQWQWMPGLVIMSQLCPEGMEATMFALLAGCTNLGGQISDFFGAFLLQRLGIHPTGAQHESAQFTDLWKASCIATLMPALTIFLIPKLIPDCRQTDRLLSSVVTSATAGSPLSQFRRWANAEDDDG
jgi:folate/biopterin transporter